MLHSSVTWHILSLCSRANWAKGAVLWSLGLADEERLGQQCSCCRAPAQEVTLRGRQCHGIGVGRLTWPNDAAEQVPNSQSLWSHSGRQVLNKHKGAAAVAVTKSMYKTFQMFLPNHQNHNEEDSMGTAPPVAIGSRQMKVLRTWQYHHIHCHGETSYKTNPRGKQEMLQDINYSSSDSSSWASMTYYSYVMSHEVQSNITILSIIGLLDPLSSSCWSVWLRLVMGLN